MNCLLKDDLKCLGEGCTCQSSSYSYDNQELWKSASYYAFDRAPIDILTSKLKIKKVKTKINYQKSKGTIIINNNSRFFIPHKLKSYIKYLGEKYYLVQFHQHHSAENRIDGLIAPMEFHFVHKNDKGEMLVMALLVDFSNSSSEIMSWSENLFSYDNNIDIILNLESLNSLSDLPSYLFNAGLTTPPFDTGIKWILFSYLDIKELKILNSDYQNFAKQYPNNKANELSPYQENRYAKEVNYLTIFKNQPCST